VTIIKVLEKRVLQLQTRTNKQTELLNRIFAAEDKLSNGYYDLEKFVGNVPDYAEGYGLDSFLQELDGFSEVVINCRKEMKEL